MIIIKISQLNDKLQFLWLKQGNYLVIPIYALRVEQILSRYNMPIP